MEGSACIKIWRIGAWLGWRGWWGGWSDSDGMGRLVGLGYGG